MKARHFYLICCVLGLVLPYAQFVPWLLEHGLNVALLVHELFGNRISAFFAMDVIVSAIVLIWFIQSEANVRGSGFFGCDGWNIARWCIVWIPVFSFSKAGDIGPNNCSGLAEP